MSLLEKSKFLLRKYRVFPQVSLGQNFMVDASILKVIVDYASLNRNDVVLDVGAGLGFFTRFLADKCGCVLAVEYDARLVTILREQLKELPNVKIIAGNVLKLDIPPFNKIVSIPPYQISSPLILLLFRQKFDCAVLIFQKEFANRLVAPVGSEHYGWLTVVAYYHLEVELLDDVSKEVFYPQPKVSSIIVRLKPKKPLPFVLKNEHFFEKLVQSMFTRRNRKVRNAVLPFIKSAQTADEKALDKIAECLPFRDKRVRELAPEDFGALSNALAG